ncbi:hypothetical protein PAERUG_P45_London_17_VIM_2_12_12_00116 [Pseudomonas aeruginosa]|nr:hypothetical protein PAERUG_P45_London_17_VIM_2_12_12_00116 [Pseudomonas aeruginosa]
MVLGHLDDEDGVLRREADDGDQADLEVDVVGQTAQAHPEQCAEYAQRHHQDHRQRDRPAFVEGGQGEEHDQHREGEQRRRLGAGQAFFEGLAGPLVGDALGQSLHQLLHRLHGFAAAVARRGLALEVERGIAVVAGQLRRAEGPGGLGERRQRHHLALLVAHVKPADVVDAQALGAVGLDHHLAHLAAVHEVADVVRAEHHRQGGVDLVHAHAEGLRLAPVDVQADLRRLALAGEHHVGQARVLGGARQQLVAGLDQGLVANPATVLQAEVEAAGGTQVRQRRRVHRIHRTVGQAGEALVDALDDGADVLAGLPAFRPVLQGGEDHRRAGAVAVQAEAADRIGVGHRFVLRQVALDVADVGHGLRHRRAFGLHHHDHEVALVLFRQERLRQAHEEQGDHADDQGVDQHPADRPGEDAGHRVAVASGQAQEGAVEPAEEAALLVVVGVDRAQQGGAQGRGQRQREERREADGDRQGHRELAVDVAHRAAEERHRHEHRDQHYGDADDGPADLAHRLDRGVVRRQAFLGHQPLDVLHHDDRVVHQDADRQDHAEHGQHVDREAQAEHHREGAQQGHRHHQCRDQGGAEVLHEQVHHGEHQQHRLEQGADHLPDRDLDERRGVIGDVVAHALREVARQLVEGGADALGGGHRVGAGRHLHRQAGGGHLVDPRDEAVLALAELDAGHVAQADRAAVGADAQRNFAELLGRHQGVVDLHRGADRRRVGDPEVADVAHGEPGVVPAHGVDQVAGAEVHRGQLGRVGPDAHGVLGAPGLDLAHALHPAQRLQHVGRGDLAQLHGVVAAAGGGKGNDQLDAVRRLLHVDAVAPHRFGQARLDDLQAVLHFHRGEVGVHALAEGQGQRGLAGAAGGLGVEQAGRAVHLALDDRGHRFLDHLGRGAGIAGADVDHRRRDVRVLGDRQEADRQDPGEHDQQGDHPGEDRPVNEETSHS